MYTPFSSMPDDSRVWIYQADRELNDQDMERIGSQTRMFLENWTSHDLHLKASYDFRHKRFLILLIDESTAGAGGCSIDKSIHFIRQLEADYKIQFMNRFLFAYKKGGRVEVVVRDEFQKLVDSGVINDETIVFNNLVPTKLDLLTNWEIRFLHSWHRTLVTN